MSHYLMITILPPPAAVAAAWDNHIPSAGDGGRVRGGDGRGLFEAHKSLRNILTLAMCPIKYIHVERLAKSST